MQNNNMNNPLRNQSYEMMAMNQPFFIQHEDWPAMRGASANRVAYPEIYYRLQPHIMMVCDQMEPYDAMPTQDMVEQMADGIYEDVCRMYPDLADMELEKTGADSEATEVVSRYPRGGDRRSRRRGSLRDLVGILLLSELFDRRRRRRPYYYY